MAHDCVRHGTTTLFAALDVQTGVVIGDYMPRRRNKDFLRFQRRSDREVQGKCDVHLILYNFTKHKMPEVKGWLDKHPRFKLHFTPTSALLWLNLMARFFSEITARRVQRRSYSSIDDLEESIFDDLLRHIAKPKPFVWNKTADDIIARERRALNALDETKGNR